MNCNTKWNNFQSKARKLHESTEKVNFVKAQRIFQSVNYDLECNLQKLSDDFQPNSLLNKYQRLREHGP